MENKNQREANRQLLIECGEMASPQEDYDGAVAESACLDAFQKEVQFKAQPIAGIGEAIDFLQATGARVFRLDGAWEVYWQGPQDLEAGVTFETDAALIVDARLTQSVWQCALVGGAAGVRSGDNVLDDLAGSNRSSCVVLVWSRGDVGGVA